MNIHHLLNFRFKNRFIQNLYNNLANWPFNPVAAPLLLLSNVDCEMNRKGRSHHSGQTSRPITEKRFLPKSSNEYYRLRLLARTLAGFDLVTVPNVIIFVLRDIKGRIRSIVRRETAIQPSVGAKPGLAR